MEVSGRRLFSASADKTIRVWDIESRRCEHVLEDHTRPVLSLAIHMGRLFSGSYDYTIKVSTCCCAAALQHLPLLHCPAPAAATPAPAPASQRKTHAGSSTISSSGLWRQQQRCNAGLA